MVYFRTMRTKANTTRRSVSIPQALYEVIEHRAQENNKTLNQEIVYLVAAGVRAEAGSDRPISEYVSGQFQETDDVVAGRKRLFGRKKEVNAG